MSYWYCGYVESILVLTSNKQTEVLRGKVLTTHFHIVQLKNIYRSVDKANVTKSYHLV